MGGVITCLAGGAIFCVLGLWKKAFDRIVLPGLIMRRSIETRWLGSLDRGLDESVKFWRILFTAFGIVVIMLGLVGLVLRV